MNKIYAGKYISKWMSSKLDSKVIKVFVIVMCCFIVLT